MALWQERWQQIRRCVGGQSEAFIVESKTSRTEFAFLKILGDLGNSSERRARFFREANCYRTLQHIGIPQLIETNASSYEEKSVELYLVTELIDGPNLAEYVRQNGPRPAAEAIGTTIQLLDILAYAHGEDAVHRDVKPENVILRNGDPQQPALVDFGLGFLAHDESDGPETHAGQEIGNRFLRLPEFVAGSTNKRDPRSDVTLCLGILLFLLTGRYPRTLSDDTGKPPHARDEDRIALKALINCDVWALLDVFDRGFEPSINARWQSAEELKKALTNVRLGRDAVPDIVSDEAAVQRVKELMVRHDEVRIGRINAILTRVGQLMRAAQEAAVNELSPHYISSTSGPMIDMPNKKVTAMLGLTKATDWSVHFHPRLEAVLQGDDIVLRATSPEQRILHRYSVEQLEEDDAGLEHLKSYLLRGVAETLSK